LEFFLVWVIWFRLGYSSVKFCLPWQEGKPLPAGWYRLAKSLFGVIFDLLFNFSCHSRATPTGGAGMTKWET